MMKKNQIIILLLLLGISAAEAQWKTGLAVLQIGAGARPAAMGESIVAAAQDAGSSFWNPAGIAQISRRQAHFSHNQWIQDIQQSAAAVAFPRGKWAIGLHALVNSVSDIEQRITPTEEPLGTFSAHDVVFGLNLARHLGDKATVGINVRYLHEKIYVESASGFSMDFGVQYRTPIKGLWAGAALQHLGAMSELQVEEVTLPRTLRAGISYALPVSASRSFWLVTADYVSVQDQESHLHVGTELRPVEMLALRAGYMAGYEARDLSAGFGLRFGRSALDYAYIPFKEDLGQAHRFSFTLQF